jgi:hypothetical protein
VPTDDEFRRVAEDVRALVRSLVRDLHAGVDEARKEANRSGRLIGDEMRKVARQSRQDLRAAGRLHQHRRYHRWEAQSGAGTDEVESTRLLPARPRRPPRPARRPPPPLRHRRDSSTVLGLVVLILGLSWLAAATHLFAVPWKAAVAVALMALGAAMVVTARTDWALSRRAWPMVLGAVLVAVLALGTASISWPSFGSRQFTWTTWNAVPQTIDGGSGQATVSLTGLPSLSGDKALEVREGAGSLVINLPASLRVHLAATIDGGTISYPQGQVGGFRQHVNRELGPPDGPTLNLTVRAGFGSVHIQQRGSA